MPAERTTVQVVVFDVLGREVANLHDGLVEAGEHRLPFDGADLPSGLYVVRASAGAEGFTEQVTLLR